MPRILCLHGSHQDAEIFSQRLRQFLKKAEGNNVVVDFAEGTFELPLQVHLVLGARAVVRGIPTARRDGRHEDMVPQHVGDCCAPSAIAGKRVTPQDAVAAVSRRAEEVGPVDGLLGFSQGGMLALVLGLMKDTPGAPSFLSNVKYIITAGASLRDEELSAVKDCPVPSSLPSLHFAGERDAVVSVDETQSVSRYYADAKIRLHPQGHVFPQRFDDLDCIFTFIVAHTPEGSPDPETPDGGTGEITDEAREELESLECILSDDFKWNGKATASIIIPIEGGPHEGKAVRMDFRIPASYPATSPGFLLCEEKSAQPGWLSKAAWYRNLIGEIQSTFEDLLGNAVLYEASQAVKRFIEETTEDAAEEDDDTDAVKEAMGEETPEEQSNNARLALESAATVAITEEEWAEAWGKGGQWKYVIGLVGKPSAGKSTFFNAATGNDRAAKVAPHPFTTIEPNVGEGFASVPCPCREMLGGVCEAMYGHTASGDRFVPIRVRDVAGLVPGAYQGKGKGNRFLNDLNDADVLVHIVDASAQTDAEGVARPTGGRADNVIEEVAWVRAEIHQWIYTNVRHKWSACRRRPEKLPIMFTGYHATEAMVHLAAHKAGFSRAELGNLATWTPAMLHRLVAFFVRLRFPILLALNKCDLPHAREHAAEVRRRFPHEPVIEVAASMEAELLRLRREKRIEYQVGGPPRGDLPGQVGEYFASSASSGVTEALAAAVTLRPAVRVYPVTSHETLQSFGTSPLLHCLLLRPGSTAFDLFTAMKSPSLRLLEGDYVRATRVVSKGHEVLLKKDAPLTQGDVVKVMTNRKSRWQEHHHKDGPPA